MRVLVTGATGFIGRHVVAGLMAAGHEVVACVRHPARTGLPAAVATIACDFTADLEPEAWLPRLAGVDAVINAVGIISEEGGQRFAALHRDAPIALFEACARAGVRRVVQISALGADADAATPFHLTKRAADDALAALPLEWVVLRPSLVYGQGGASYRLFQALAALPLLPLVDGGRQPVQPVHITDLVRAVVLSVSNTAPLRQRIDVVGGATLTLAGYIALLRRRLGYRPAHVVAVPHTLADAFARLAGSRGGLVTPDSLSMLRRAAVAPLQPLIDALGLHPATPEQALPRAQESERLGAALYFVSPLLRFTIGFTWVWAGLTSALLFPPDESRALLARTGITGESASLALYGAALLDLALGICTWARFRIHLVAKAQLAVTLLYTAILTVFIPELWLHPFGPLAKNLPLLAATLAMLALERPQP